MHTTARIEIIVEDKKKGGWFPFKLMPHQKDVFELYENNELVYSASFYTSTGITGNIPTHADFSGSVVTAFDTLGYDYSFSGTAYTIVKPTEEVKLSILLKLNPLKLSPNSLYISNIFKFCSSAFEGRPPLFPFVPLFFDLLSII